MEENIDCYGIISKEFIKEFHQSTGDITIDYGEIALGSIFKSNITSEFPVIKTLASICKIGMAVRERFFAKKLLIFLNEYRSGTIDPEKKIKFLDDMSNEKYRDKVIDTIMIFVEGFKEISKAKVYGNLFNSYINGLFDWDKFIYYSNCVDLLFVQDIKVLGHYYKSLKISDYYQNEDCIKTSLSNKGVLNRLEHLGFLQSDISQTFKIAEMSLGGETRVPSKVIHTISSEGVLFYETGISLGKIDL